MCVKHRYLAFDVKSQALKSLTVFCQEHILMRNYLPFTVKSRLDSVSYFEWCSDFFGGLDGTFGILGLLWSGTFGILQLLMLVKLFLKLSLLGQNGI